MCYTYNENVLLSRVNLCGITHTLLKSMLILMNYYLGLSLTGIITGIFAGLVGSGAEILIVPLLSIFSILGSLKERIGTSLFMILPPIGIFSALLTNYNKEVLFA